jgi:DNA-binding IclR family transcriptional regulator
MQVELAAVRKNGYAVDNMETDLGVRCVGVPILDRNREVVGALSISGSVLTFNDERVSDLAEKLKEAVSEIEKTI